MPPTARFVRTSAGIRSFVERPGKIPQPHKWYADEIEVAEAVAKARSAGWNVVHDPDLLTNSIRTAQGLNTGATSSINKNPELGNPMLETYWGKVSNRYGNYLKSDLTNPYIGAPNPSADQYIDLEKALSQIDDIAKSGGIDKGTYDLMMRSDRASADGFRAIGERAQSISDQYSILDHARQELGEEVSKEIVVPKQFVISNDNPRYQGVINYANQSGYLNDYSRYKLPQTWRGIPYRTTDVALNVSGTAPQGQRTFAPESDSYSMAPQWTREPRNAQIVRLPVPTREEAIAEARLANGLGRSAYRSEQRDLMLQRPGSFNIYTEPEYLKTFAPETAADDAIAGVYSRGKPYQTQVDANGYVTNVPDNLDIHVPGLGRFPLTRGRTLERIPLSKTDPPSELNADGTFEMRSKTAGGHSVKAYSMPDDVYERDGNIPLMMDGLQALQAKEQLTNAAWAKYESSLRSPTVSDLEVNQLRSIAEQHKSELESAHGAYSSALNILEPQPISQRVVTSINVPALGDYPELLRSHGLDIVAATPSGQGIQIQASGYIPIEKQVALSGELSSRLNRQELVLPRDVSIANANYKAFKEAGIPDNALVRGAEWGMTPDGKPTVINPGSVVGQWEGQRITRGNVKEPTVREIPTAAAPVYESDPEWQQFLEQRDLGKLVLQREKRKDIEAAINSARARNGLGVLIPTTNEQREAARITDAVNAVRARNGLPPLGTDSTGQVSYREMPSQISSWDNPDYRQAIISQPLQTTKTNMPPTNLPLMPFNSDFEIEKLNLARASQKYRSGAAQVESPLPAYGSRSGRAFSQYGKQAPAYNINFEAPANYSYNGVGATPDLSTFLPAATPTVVTPGQLAVRPQPEPAQAVVRPATVNLNQMPDVIDVQAIPVVDAPRYFRTDIPIEGDDAAWAYNRPPQSVPQPVMVQDPANTWMGYIPAAAALGGLGLGAGIGYAMAPRNSQEEEQLRQQVMQQQMYLQQMQQIRGGRR